MKLSHYRHVQEGGDLETAPVSGDSAANKIGSGSGMVAPGFTSKVSVKYSKTEINIFVELLCEDHELTS